ncbi:hypothetical protein Tco_0797077 [Tanacetum coccineum]
MSADSAVTYTSVHSEARSWSIPSEDPYEEAARQLLEQAPRSPEYVPDPMELEDHVPVYIPEPEHPEDLVPAEDEAPTPLLPPSFLAPRIPTSRPRSKPSPSSRRADIPEADTPPQKRLLLTTPKPGCEVGESSAAAAARQPGPTMETRLRDWNKNRTNHYWNKNRTNHYSRHGSVINCPLIAGGTFMQKTPEECYELIENMTAHHNHWDTSATRDETSRNISSTTTTESPEVVRQLEMMNKNFCPAGDGYTQEAIYATTVPNYQAHVGPSNELTHYTKSNEATLRAMQTHMTNMKTELRNEFKSTIDARTNKIENQNNQIMNILTNMQNQNSSGLGSLPSNTVANPRGDVKAITTRSGVAYDGLTIPPTPSPLPKEVEHETKETKDKQLSLLELTLTRMTLEIVNQSVAQPKGVAEDIFMKVGKFYFLADFVVVVYDVDPRVPLIPGRPLLRTERALIDVYGEELKDCDIGCEPARGSKLLSAHSYFGFNQPPQYSINHQEDLNQQRISDVHNGWDKIDELQNELLQMIQSFCEKFLQQKQADSIDQSPLQEMSLQEMEDLKHHYLDEMLSLSNDLGIKDYRNEKIDIHFRRECENMIDELKGKFNGMSIEINKKKELQQLEQAAKLSTYTTEPSRRFNYFYDDDDEESSIPLRDIISKLPHVEDLVPIPSESEDTSGSDSVCDLPSCDDFSPINVYKEKSVTFSNPLFDSNDDFTSSDDESLSDEDVPEDNMKIYSNPLFEFDDEYISSDINPLFDKVLEDIECKDSYDSNLDESTFLVTPLSDSNEDECFIPSDDVELLLHRDSSTPMISVVSILEGFTDEPPLEENDDLFNLESKKNEWKKILYDDPIDDLIFDPGGDIDEIDAFLDIGIPTNIKDGFYDSEGDVLYLESLLSNDTTPSPPPKVFLDHDPRSLSDINDLKIMVKVFDPEIHEKNYSHTYVSLTFEDRHYISFTYVIRIFLRYFTYQVDSFLPLSSGSEDIIFDPNISAFHFSSLKSVAYKCPMEVCSSTCLIPNIMMIWGEIASDFEDSRARGFVHRPLDLQSFTCLYIGIRYPRSY